MTPPRDPSAPEGYPERQGTSSFIVREYTPIEPMNMQSPSQSEKKWPSTGFIVSLSVILGIIIAGSAIIGGLGKAFFVSRDEYTRQELVYTDDKSTIRQTLSRFETVMEKQGQALDHLVESVHSIKVDMARQGRSRSER
jgi:hypothetical protein